MDNITFYKGALSGQILSDTILALQEDLHAGAYNVFLGQVRADEIKGKTVSFIEFTAYEEMVPHAFEEIVNQTKIEFPDVRNIQVFHSLGKIKAGELCFIVLVTSGHRDSSFQACRKVTEAFKFGIPVFGKELFEDDSHQWKINK